jgi:hypothetical protein
MPLYLAFIAFIFASGICVLLVGLARAPIGYEDDNGFHALRPVKQPRLTSMGAPTGLHEVSGRTC